MLEVSVQVWRRCDRAGDAYGADEGEDDFCTTSGLTVTKRRSFLCARRVAIRRARVAVEVPLCP
jgi:hypothetical protein